MTDKTNNKPYKPQTAFSFFCEAVSNHPKKVGFMFLFEILQALFVLLLPFVIKDLVNAIVAIDPQAQTDIWPLIETPFRNFILVSIALLLSARASGTILAFLAPVFRLKPREKMVAHLQTHSVNFFQSRHSGALGNKINEGCNGLGFGLWTFTFDVWPIFIKFLISVVLLYLASQTMGLIMLGWSLIYFAVIIKLGFKQSAAIEYISRARSKITGHVVDMATNIQAVKSFANESYERDMLRQNMNEERQFTTGFQIIREISGWFHSIMGLTITVTLMYVALNEYIDGLVTVGDIAFMFSLILIVTEQSRGLLWSFTHFLEHLGQLNDGVKTVMQPHILKDKEGAAELHVKTPTIEYKAVHFKYPETIEDIKTRVFEDFNLTIPAGQKIGLIGQSGAGKSTLINLLMRFYDIDSGTISIDKQNITDVTQSSLRKNISVISQDTTLFHRSMMDNIRYGQLDASDEDVIKAAKQAHAHGFIQDMPDGYQTMVGERGVRLSGGQRQRIAIARAALKKAKILILDEATSALDSESENKIQQSLESLMHDKTVIAIAHRLSTIAHLDRLIVIENGKIIEDGTHNELKNKKNGHYAKLWSMQSGGFLKG